MGIEDTETCEICSEEVTYCCCWRCMTCEQLFPEDASGTDDSNGETICHPCLEYAIMEWQRQELMGLDD